MESATTEARAAGDWALSFLLDTDASRCGSPCAIDLSCSPFRPSPRWSSALRTSSGLGLRPATSAVESTSNFGLFQVRLLSFAWTTGNCAGRSSFPPRQASGRRALRFRASSSHSTRVRRSRSKARLICQVGNKRHLSWRSRRSYDAGLSLERL
jgi:hypothetical protein